LALELNNLSVAAEAAAILNDPATWEQLAAHALLNGDIALAETAYQRARAYSQLQLLYLSSGQLDKLRRLARVYSVQQE
jgi:Coatomer WD associated region